MVYFTVSDDKRNAKTETYITETKWNKETGLPLVQFVKLNGLKHSPPDGSPSYILFDDLGRPKIMKWHNHDKLHRDKAGAWISIDPETKVHTTEAFFHHGRQREQHLGPSCIYRDPSTGDVFKTENTTGTKPPSPSC